jgi:hypothetical protein
VALTHGISAALHIAMLLGEGRWNGATTSGWVPVGFAVVAWFGGVRGWVGDPNGGRLCVGALAAQSVGWCADFGSYLWISGPALTLQWSATVLRLHVGWETSVLIGLPNCEQPTIWVNFVPPLLLGAWAIRVRFHSTIDE